MSIIDQIADERDKAQQENKLLKDRIKRLEELLWLSQPICEAKEAKP